MTGQTGSPRSRAASISVDLGRQIPFEDGDDLLHGAAGGGDPLPQGRLDLLGRGGQVGRCLLPVGQLGHDGSLLLVRTIYFNDVKPHCVSSQGSCLESGRGTSQALTGVAARAHRRARAARADAAAPPDPGRAGRGDRRLQAHGGRERAPPGRGRPGRPTPASAPRAAVAAAGSAPITLWPTVWAWPWPSASPPKASSPSASTPTARWSPGPSKPSPARPAQKRSQPASAPPPPERRTAGRRRPGRSGWPWSARPIRWTGPPAGWSTCRTARSCSGIWTRSRCSPRWWPAPLSSTTT